MKEPEKAPEEAKPASKPAEPKEAPAVKPEKPVKAADKAELEPPKNRKMLDAMVGEHGIDAVIDELKKVKVVDLRSLAREYNGEFGIAGREIRNANKKVLIDEFRKFFTE